ncbi:MULTISPECIES: serine hydrolase [Blautia]|uniref:serine hydrolase n=1 Tax=Blautia TaxID=572511 RepID=UPI000BA35312|nr:MULTISPECIES: serine hydrolase [Blautia]
MRRNKVKRYRKTQAYKLWSKIFIAGCVLLFCGIILLSADFFLYQKRNEKQEHLKELKQQEEEMQQEVTAVTSSQGEDKAAESSESYPKESLDENELTKQLTQEIQQLDGDWSIYVEQINTGVICDINDQKYPAASLIKLFIMGTVYEEYDELCENYGQEDVDRYLEQMITASDNDSANQLVSMLGEGIDEAGRNRVNLYCQENEYNNTNMGRMLLESTENGENYTSTKDCGEFLKKVYLNKCNHSLDMLEYLKHQERTEKIPSGVPEGIEVANKTGELSDVENDAAVVLIGDDTYSITVIASNLSDTSSARVKIREFSSEVYHYFVE